MSIQDVETKIALLLARELKHTLANTGYSIPDTFQPRVSLLDANGRKKRSNAAASNWSPNAGLIQISFEPVDPATSESAPSNLPIASNEEKSLGAFLSDAEEELLRALDRAESTPGWTFVPLKKFRDEILPQEPRRYLAMDKDRERVLREAINKKLVVRGQVPNPKAPQFPVTTVRVNRLLPEVNALFGATEASDIGFSPIEIKGEPLSATILRERR